MAAAIKGMIGAEKSAWHFGFDYDQSSKISGSRSKLGVRLDSERCQLIHFQLTACVYVARERSSYNHFMPVFASFAKDRWRFLNGTRDELLNRTLILERDSIRGSIDGPEENSSDLVFSPIRSDDPLEDVDLILRVERRRRKLEPPTVLYFDESGELCLYHSKDTGCFLTSVAISEVTPIA